MKAPILNQNISLKKLEIENEGNKYICKIHIIKELLEISLFLDNSLKYEGYISLPQIQTSIGVIDYNINEIFEEIKLLDSNCFLLIKELNEYILKIKFIIFRKEKFLSINLRENKKINLQKDDLMNYIIELKEIIKTKEEKIKNLEEKLKKYSEKEKITNEIMNTNNNLYDNFDIKLKEPIHKLKNHTSSVYCLTLLNDGRLVSGSSDKSIIIYNKTTYQPDLIIKEHTGCIYCLTQLSTGVLASCSSDKTIKLFNINNNNYNILQTLNIHTDEVNKIIELKNKKLVSCSIDKSIIFYFKDNNQYTKDFNISTNGICTSVIQTLDNEICYSEKTNKAICFFELKERKKISTLNNINKKNDYYEWFYMITKDLLLIPGQNKISIINVNNHNLVKTIDVPGSGWICGICLLNQNMLLTGDWNEIIRQWRIEDDNLILISKKEKIHDGDINFLLNIGNGHIASASDDCTIKIW